MFNVANDKEGTGWLQNRSEYYYKTNCFVARWPWESCVQKTPETFFSTYESESNRGALIIRYRSEWIPSESFLSKLWKSSPESRSNGTPLSPVSRHFLLPGATINQDARLFYRNIFPAASPSVQVFSSSRVLISVDAIHGLSIAEKESSTGATLLMRASLWNRDTGIRHRSGGPVGST